MLPFSYSKRVCSVQSAAKRQLAGSMRETQTGRKAPAFMVAFVPPREIGCFFLGGGDRWYVLTTFS